ncbi:hypothetical protein ABZ851_29895 [Streptomyces sp. NPDC047049]|uniref:hypothetical protein n=1 Tax=Streptomyces sp. NPDC047049 TaxID=3156688 RepID=UPI0034112972
MRREMDPTALFLVAQFGPKLVAEFLDDADKRRHARDTFHLIASNYRREGGAIARAWMSGMNPHLDDDAPFLVIGAGRGAAALDAARRHVTGNDAH